MHARELAVAGAFAFAAQAYPDDRGMFVSPFQQPAYRAALGDRLFAVEQVSFSVSRLGVVRGVHYTATPPGGAKYVFCSSGRVLDVVVDIRVGSPTFGRWDAVLLGREHPHAVCLPVGVGHLFVALEDGSVMNYVLSAGYVPELERELAPFDPALRLPIPQDVEAVLSERDRAAPTLAQAREVGLLPDYERCRELQARLGGEARWPAVPGLPRRG